MSIGDKEFRTGKRLQRTEEIGQKTKIKVIEKEYRKDKAGERK